MSTSSRPWVWWRSDWVLSVNWYWVLPAALGWCRIYFSKRKTRSCSLLSLLWMPRTVLFSYFFSPGFPIFWCWLEFMGSVESFWANVSVIFLLYNTVSAAQAGWTSTSHCFQFWNIHGISLNFPRRRIVTASRDGNSQDVKASNSLCLPDCLWVDAFVIYIRGPGPRQAPGAGWVSPLLLLCNTLHFSHSWQSSLGVHLSLSLSPHTAWLMLSWLGLNQSVPRSCHPVHREAEVTWHSSNIPTMLMLSKLEMLVTKNINLHQPNMLLKIRN